MQFDYFREYVVFAKYLNFTHAAAELHMTQSGLSKHMKQLESELGFSLVTSKNNRITLTQAGSRFLKAVQVSLDAFQNVVEECRALDKTEPLVLLAQQPLYPDEASKKYYELLQGIKSICTNARVKFILPSRRNLLESLKTGKLHLIVDYRMGKVETRMDKYRESGFVCKLLAEEPLAAWVTKGSPLDKESISPLDLDGQTILIPNETCFLMDKSIRQLCRRYRLSPHLEITDTSSQAEFLSLDYPQGIYLYPQSVFENSTAAQAVNSRVIVPFNSSEMTVKAFAVAHAGKTAESLLAQELLAEKH